MGGLLVGWSRGDPGSGVVGVGGHNTPPVAYVNPPGLCFSDLSRLGTSPAVSWAGRGPLRVVSWHLEPPRALGAPSWHVGHPLGHQACDGRGRRAWGFRPLSQRIRDPYLSGPNPISLLFVGSAVAGPRTGRGWSTAATTGPLT